MLTLFISNSVVTTFYRFHWNNGLNYNLTQADVSAQTAQDVNAFGRSPNIADCFPEFSIKYPGASVEVNLSSVEAPTPAFSGQNSLKISFLGLSIFRARLPDGFLVDFLSTEVSMETSVLLEFNLGNLKGTVTSILPKSITVVKSCLESVNRDVLKAVFDLIAEQFLHRLFEEVTQRGIPLPHPLLSGVGVEGLENVDMATEDGFLRIDIDLKFCA